MSKVSYASAVGCLMYAMVCTRPDLAHAVSQVCKYMSKPGRHHWEVLKWIFRYLKGTHVGHGIIFDSQQHDPLVVGYVDSDYAEYMAVAEAAKEALWLNGLAKELGVEQGRVQLHCDSQSAIYLAKNQAYHARTNTLM
ncbi:UNVERIFIED_CONTAM: Retrovirus-related Pol polyprotein from transposon TNT 1-94 [Sesamum latifolium]|uniref:Retrovirus-related Pol polyprotein from transposon TNT 1-94 n=1 Tax=Sesamum latifolium TaxID=2727402 RepID=A0AAW2XWI6_9LAMI